METKDDDLLVRLEQEGLQIAKYRKNVFHLLQSGKKINCKKMMHLCTKLNEHIDAFDRINAEYIQLEKIS